MARPSGMPNLGKLRLHDDGEDAGDPFASPDGGATTASSTSPSQKASSRSNNDSKKAAAQEEAREAALHAELERVKEVNRVIESVTASLTKAKDNMGTVQQTVANASTLLATWTRILSQTEYNQRLILDPTWQGASRDIEDQENEEMRRQADAERRALEEQRRREEAARRAEEEERRKAAGTPASTRGVSRTRSVRGSTTGVRRGYTGVGGQSTRGTGSTVGTRGSGIGRGTATARARGRG